MLANIKIQSPAEESSVAKALTHRGYELYFPVVSEQRNYSDRVRFVEVALFPGYLFCRFDPAKRSGVLSSPGVQYVVGSEYHDHSVPERDIESIQRAIVAGGKPTSYLAAGQRARIVRGVMAGVEGILQRVDNQNRITLSIALLQRSVAVQVDLSQVQVI